MNRIETKLSTDLVRLSSGMICGFALMLLTELIFL